LNLFRFSVIFLTFLTGAHASEPIPGEELRIPISNSFDQYLTSPLGDCSGLRESVTENRKLMKQLKWFISGDEQKGWLIYYPLIAQFLETDAKPDSVAFAEAVSRWQFRSGCRMPPDGVLESSTLMSILLEFQSRRFDQTRRIPQETKMIRLTKEYSHHSAKTHGKLQLGEQTLLAYKEMVAAARKAGIRGDFLKVISGYRSVPDQNSLRLRSPSLRSNRLAVQSVHNTGRAIDLYVGGDPVNTSHRNRKKQVASPAYVWLLKNASRFGFVPYYFEPWHWEFVGLESAAAP